MSALLLIGDVGATNFALALVDEHGNIIAREDGPGANLKTHISIDGFVWVLSSQLKKLLKTRAKARGVEPSDVLFEIRAAQLAISGVETDQIPKLTQQIERGLLNLKIRFPLKITDSVLPTFTSNKLRAPTGILAMSGTGTTTAAIIDNQIIRRHGGLGWVLGDTASGTWMGRQILRAAAADLEGLGPRTVFTEMVLQELSISTTGLDDEPRPAQVKLTNLKRVVDNLKPANWSRFAPLHDKAIAMGDPAAKHLLGRATNYLVASLESCRQALIDENLKGEYPLVWAGGVALNSTHLREAVESRLQQTQDEIWLVPTLATEPLMGISRLAAKQFFNA